MRTLSLLPILLSCMAWGQAKPKCKPPDFGEYSASCLKIDGKSCTISPNLENPNCWPGERPKSNPNWPLIDNTGSCPVLHIQEGEVICLGSDCPKPDAIQPPETWFPSMAERADKEASGVKLEPIDVPAIRVRVSMPDICNTEELKKLPSGRNWCREESVKWTCADKTNILQHDEQNPPKYWCHRVEAKD